jgi:hypothetical protein
MTSKRISSGIARRPRKSGRATHVHQLLVVLANTDPLVWRRIQVPEDYSFWDLHVAIQDAMGWQEAHLHEFTVTDPRTGREQRLGIPDEEYPEERPCLPDWQAKVSHYLTEARPLAHYVYDFGDDWRHVVAYEGASPAEPGRRYPACVAGARACPPEDCGGVHGFADFLAAIADPKHPEHADLLAWVGGHYDPDAIDPVQVKFDDPRERFKTAVVE